MKKISIIIMALVLVFTAMFALTACGLFDDDNGNSTDSGEYKAATMGAVTQKCVVEQNDRYIDTMESFYDDDYNYWLFDMGTLVDVPLDDVFQYYKYNGGNVNYKYSITETTASSIKNITQSSASRSTNWSNSDKVSVKGGVNFGKKDVWGISIELGYDHTWTKGGSETTSWSKSFEKCEQKSTTEEKTVNIAFDDSCPHGYYSYRYIGIVNVYAAVVQDRATKAYNATTYTSIRAFGYSLDYDAESLSFDNYDDRKFDFDLSIIDLLQEPTQYIGNGDEEKPTVLDEITVFDKKIRTGSQKIAGSGKYTLDTFTLTKSLDDLAEMGYAKLSFTIEYDLKEVDNCKQYISLFTSTNITIRNETTYHGGSSTNKNWGTHVLSCTVDLATIDSNIFNFKCQAENAIFKDFYIGTVDVKVVAK